jgi:serine protease Do
LEEFLKGTPFGSGGIPFGGGGGVPNQQQPFSKGGSGFILDNTGKVLTNYHVVKGATQLSVTLQSGEVYSATLLGRDPYTDLAVLQVQAPAGKSLGSLGLRPVHLGQSANLRPGEWVLAIGNPLGLEHTVTVGIVSAVSRQVPDLGGPVQFIQTDAAINPGNSGGPLVNLNGEVIGINTAVSRAGQNIGFSIPIDTAKTVVQDLAQGKSIEKPYLGISLMPASAKVLNSLNLPATTQGVVIAQVVSGSPAQKAGLQPGDVLQRVKGKAISKPEDVQAMVRSAKVGESLTLDVLRQKQQEQLEVTLEALGDL